MNTIINDIGYDAACMVVTRQEASVTSLMRLLDVNEDEAKQLMHKLYEANVIGPVSEDGTAEVRKILDSTEFQDYNAEQET